MSRFSLELSVLTSRPYILESRKSLVIKTGFLPAVLSLFMVLRRVEIVPSVRRIQISRRIGLFLVRSKTLAFDEVSHIDYAYGSMGTSWGITSEGLGRHDQLESFSISIVTKREEKLFVCAFRGEGAVWTGWTGILLGNDNLMDFAGTQERESAKLAVYLSKLIGVPIGKPPVDVPEMIKCPSCGHSLAPNSLDCLYCGAEMRGMKDER